MITLPIKDSEYQSTVLHIDEFEIRAYQPVPGEKVTLIYTSVGKFAVQLSYEDVMDVVNGKKNLGSARGGSPSGRY